MAPYPIAPPPFEPCTIPSGRDRHRRRLIVTVILPIIRIGKSEFPTRSCLKPPTDGWWELAHSTRPKRSWLSSQLWKLRNHDFMRLKVAHTAHVLALRQRADLGLDRATRLPGFGWSDRNSGARLPPSACSSQRTSLSIGL